MHRYRSKLTGAAIIFGAALTVGLSVPTVGSAGAGENLIERIADLENQAQQINDQLGDFGFAPFGFDDAGFVPPKPVQDYGVHVAQSRDVAALNLRISDLENQMRSLTGQVEGVQFQITQIYQQLELMQQDADFRFEQLEGGLGKTSAVVQSGGATPVGELPQSQENESAISVSSQNEGQLSAITPNGDDPIAALDLSGVGQGDSQFSLSGPLQLDLSGENGRIDFSQSSIEGSGRALSLDFDPGALVTERDASAQYQAGYQAVLQGDYDFAIAQFRQFVDLFPAHALAPDASNWLGESLLQKQAYADAAEVFFNAFQNYEGSLRSPELLLKLGIALAGASERDTACRTFIEVKHRYQDMGAAFDRRVQDEMANAQC